jgi:hypothetical protein
MRTSILLIIFIISFGIGCADKPGTPKDYIIFGDFYGECLGTSCVDYYKIEDGQLYKDQADQYPSTGMSYQFNMYNNAYDHAVLDLATEVPNNLYNEGETIGAPDAYDQGGYYIEVCNNGNIQHWKIDKNNQDVPVYLHAICDSMEHYLLVLE